MKKLYIVSAMVALLAAATSCDKYDIYPEQYGKVLMIKNAGDNDVTIYATETIAPYYVSVMKNGHTPEDPAQATLKVLSEEEFADYKELYYGSRDFAGIQMLNPDYYYLAYGDKEMTPAEGNAISHIFESADDRYFGANVVFNAQAISDDEEVSTANKNPNANVKYVVPLGLFSNNKNDSINADNRYSIIFPKPEDPEITVSVSHDAALIIDQNRAQLKDENSAYRTGSFGKDLVKFSLPCPNPYGFKIKFNNNPAIDIPRFNGHHTDMTITALKRKADNDSLNYKLGENKKIDYIDFTAGKSEVWLPIEFFRKWINYDDMEYTYATSIQLAGLDWKEAEANYGKDVIAKIKKSIQAPKQPELTWTPNDKVEGDDGKYDGYTFFIGYRVVEQPLDMDGGCIIGANDPETTEGSFEALFDDDLSTFYHSAWSKDALKDRTSQYGSYLDFEIPTKEPINAVAFKFTARVHSSPHGPKVIKLFYSNAKTDAEREATWEPILRAGNADLAVSPTPGKDNSGSGQVTWLGGIKNDSEWIRAKEPFRYLRMCVMKNSWDKDLTSMGSNNHDYWNLAELRLYGTVIK